MLLYALTILVSAFLLFQVQPIIAKTILPWFGGAAAVWTTCLLFFQVALWLGYLYAYWLHRSFPPRRQAWLHVGLLCVSLWALPILPAAGWKPSGAEEPAFRILGLLAATVGLPYFLLSTTGPLLQAWYARRYTDAMPYRLYALSNAGSLFALLSYPVLFEPVFSTRLQALSWSAGYLTFVLLCGITALAARHAKASPAGACDPQSGPAPGWKMRLLWVALPACASVLLLAVTNHLSQNVAAIPFLWVLPLSLYLLSFILCFEGSGCYRRNPYVPLIAMALGGMAYALSDDFQSEKVKLLIPLFGLGLFLCCMVCHGELARLKPHPRHLTLFYLMVSLGGAVGGVFVGLIAPRIFSGHFELQIGLVACAVLVLQVLKADPTGFFKGWWRPAPAAGLLLVLGLIVYLAAQIRYSAREYHLRVRSFYGELRVSDSGDAQSWDGMRKLMHGTISHGQQFLNPERRDRPTTYYGPQSGVGLAIQESAQRGPLRMGVIGLGTGTLAIYGRPGDYCRFYEINPQVIELARTEFTFLKDSKAKVEVALGDARLSLEREPMENFDVLAVDAFSGDAIPVHLLTQEAFALYFRQLKDTGVLAVHVSNKYLDLRPVVRLAAESLGKEAMEVENDDDDPNGIFGSTWVLVTGRRAFFERPPIQGAATPVEPGKGLRLWTDNYSNLFQILK